MTIIIGHRGCKAKPENTLAAFRHALESGAEGVEMDVYLSRDDQLVVIHDDQLQKAPNGAEMVRQRSLDELKNLQTRDPATNQLEPVRVSTLKEVLEALHSYRRKNPLTVILELKDESAREAVCKLVEHYVRWEMFAYEDFVLTSQQLPLLIESKKQWPALRICPILGRAPSESELKSFITLKPYALSLRVQSVKEEMVRDLQLRGIKIMAWMENEPLPEDNLLQIRKLWRLNILGFITDYPAELRKVMVSEGSSNAGWNVKAGEGQEKAKLAIDKGLNTRRTGKWSDNVEQE